MLENLYGKDLIENLSSAAKGTCYFHSLKLRQGTREILPTLPWCSIILTNLRRAVIMSPCFLSCPLLLSYMPCPTTTLKNHCPCLILVTKRSICFQKCISSFWADYNSWQLLFSTSRSASFAYLYIFFHHVHPCVSSVSHASSELTDYTASGKSYCSLFLYNSCLNLLLKWKLFIIFIPVLP